MKSEFDLGQSAPDLNPADFYNNWIDRFGADDDLKPLTLVLSTYNRHSEALRTIRMLSGFKLSVLLLDNSPQGLELSAQERLPSNCKYVHHPESFRWQQMNLTRWISTPYATLVDDDNIPLLYGLMSAVRIMQADASLGCCASLLAGYRGGLQGNIVPILMHHEILANITLTKVLKGNLQNADASFGNTSPDASERLKNQLFGNWRGQAWYAVHRTENLVRNFKAVAAIGELSTSRSSSEVALEALTAWGGPIGYIPFVTQLRALDISSIEVTGSERFLSYDAWFHGNQYRSEVRAFEQVLLENMAPQSVEQRDFIISMLANTAKDERVNLFWRLLVFLKEIEAVLIPRRRFRLLQRIRDCFRGSRVEADSPLPDAFAPDLDLVLRWLNSTQGNSYSVKP